MKTRHPVLVAPLFILVLLDVAAARAQSLELVLTDPNQTVMQGTTLVAFDATVLNPSTTDTIYLNGDASTTPSPYLSVNDAPFFANAPLLLGPGASTGPFELFEVDLGASAPVGTYAKNTFSILGGADGGTFADFSDISDAQFSVTVSSADVAAAPEIDPGSAFGALTLLVGSLLALRSRRARAAT